MNIVDLLVMIIVVTILVTISLGVVTYFAYKLRRARRPTEDSHADSESWYFIRHEPPLSEVESAG
jgi:heme/copper-type cytochrome/quinol oxidase subunit 2